MPILTDPPALEGLWMLHGVVRRRDVPAALAALADVDGVTPGARLTLPRSGRFAGLASDLSAGGLDAAGAAEMLGDQEAAARLAMAHNRVLCAVAARTDVAPTRFGALFTRRDALTSELKRQAVDVDAALRRTAGAAEYLLRLTLSAEAGTDASANARSHGSDLAAAAPDGRGYLQNRLAARRRRGAADALRSRARSDITAGAAEIARALQERPTRGADRALDLALLVDRGAEDRLAAFASARAPQAAAAGLTLQIVGPWPPASFMFLEAAA